MARWMERRHEQTTFFFPTRRRSITPVPQRHIMKALHQFVAGFSHGDAISNEALVMRGIFRSWGFESEIFCEQRRILPELRREARDVQSYAATAKADDVVLLHLSIGSDVNDVFATLHCRRAILYHHVTPSRFFERLNPPMAAVLDEGQHVLEVAEGFLVHGTG